MKVTPLLFTDVMIRALLAGIKTQTRRPLDARYSGPEVYGYQPLGGGRWQTRYQLGNGISQGAPRFNCRYGDEGDLLYAREACAAAQNKADGLDGVIYIADRKFVPIEDNELAAARWLDLDYYGLKRGHSGRRGRVVPNIHMPRWASRITMELGEVRAERLLTITHEDAVREGVKDRPEYLKLWERIHGSGSANSNPWVWVLCFRTVQLVQVDRYIAGERLAA